MGGGKTCVKTDDFVQMNQFPGDMNQLLQKSSVNNCNYDIFL